MSTTISDHDGGWWNHVIRGLGLHKRLKHKGDVVTTTDIIVIADSKILLIERGKNPYKDHWAFPGGRVEQNDENLNSAAWRELKEETNININSSDLKLCHNVGNSERDPRGFCTIVYTAFLHTIPYGVRAGDDAVEYGWFYLKNLPLITFDHI